jgi:hypothetical protein
MTPGEIVSRAEQVARDIDVRGTELCFEYVGVSTAYCSDEDVTGDWIRRFFDGYFVPSGKRGADATLYSTADSELFASLQELAPQLPAVEKDDYTEIPFPNSVTVVRKEAGKVQPPEDVYLLLFAEERKIVLVTSGNLEVRQEEGMQTLRALSKWLLLEQGWIPMHSACAAKNGQTICVTGPKASGKTSTLLNLLARNGCDLVAVDKFLIRDGGSHLEVCGIPGKIGIRVGSAIVQPQVLTWLVEATSPFFPHLSAEEVLHIAATNTPEQLRTRGEKIHLTPAELTRLFGGSITRTAPLGLVLIPVFDLNVEESRLTPTEPEQAIQQLMTCYVGLSSKGEDFLLHFFDLSDALLEQRLATLLGKHLPEVVAYDVHQNHRTNQRTAELVADLLRSGV